MTNEEKVRRELARVLTNLSNYPFEAQGQLWGRDLSGVIDKATEAVMASGVVEKENVLLHRPLVSRVELIVNYQREKVMYGVHKVYTALQDEERTLKLFVTKDPDAT